MIFPRRELQTHECHPLRTEEWKGVDLLFRRVELGCRWYNFNNILSLAKAMKKNNAYYCLLLYSTLMDASELAEVVPIKFLHYQAIT